MRRLKWAAAVMTAAAVMLAACGGTDATAGKSESTTDSSTEETLTDDRIHYNDDKEDISIYTDNSIDVDEFIRDHDFGADRIEVSNVYVKYYYNEGSEIMPDIDKVSINGVEYDLPIRVSDLEADGFTIRSTTGEPLPETIKPGGIFLETLFELPDGRNLGYTCVDNIYEDEERAFEDCWVNPVSTGLGDENPPEYIFPYTVRLRDDSDEVLMKLFNIGCPIKITYEIDLSSNRGYFYADISATDNEGQQYKYQVIFNDQSEVCYAEVEVKPTD